MPQDPHDLSTTLVRDLMTTPVHRVDMDATLLSVKQLFDRVKCHHVVVLEEKCVFGVVSDRDILRCVSPFVGNKTMERSQDLNTLKKRVHQIMSRDIVTVGPEETVAAAADKLLSEKVSCLPVVDEKNAPLGIVTIRDLVAWATGMIHHRGVNAGMDETFDDILIVIGGNRCYTPDAPIGRLIRCAEKKFEQVHGTGTAHARCLAVPAAKTGESTVQDCASAGVA